MFSVFCKKPLFVNKPLRDFILQTTNESIKRQIEFREKYKFKQFLTTSLSAIEDNNDPNRPNRPDDDTLIPYIIGFLSLSSIFYYFYFKKR
jgi:hypothetical protein